MRITGLRTRVAQRLRAHQIAQRDPARQVGRAVVHLGRAQAHGLRGDRGVGCLPRRQHIVGCQAAVVAVCQRNPGHSDLAGREYVLAVEVPHRSYG